MPLEAELTIQLKNHGTDFIRFVDVSKLSSKQNRHYPRAIVFGVSLTPGYVRNVSENTGYVSEMVKIQEVDIDEFHLKEVAMDRLADRISEFIGTRGYRAFSQSENNLAASGLYDNHIRCTPLPHKTIAGMAGLGWVGKNNLLVTPEYGSALSMCTVLTDAPLKTELHSPARPECGDCSVCTDSCLPGALKGNHWEPGSSRDRMIDAAQCTTCLQCMVQCPHTQEYMLVNPKT